MQAADAAKERNFFEKALDIRAAIWSDPDIGPKQRPRHLRSQLLCLLGRESYTQWVHSNLIKEDDKSGVQLDVSLAQKEAAVAGQTQRTQRRKEAVGDAAHTVQDPLFRREIQAVGAKVRIRPDCQSLIKACAGSDKLEELLRFNAYALLGIDVLATHPLLIWDLHDSETRQLFTTLVPTHVIGAGMDSEASWPHSMLGLAAYVRAGLQKLRGGG